jgi:phosphoribosylaminoimidazole-succinocarboxamide synthase
MEVKFTQEVLNFELLEKSEDQTPRKVRRVFPIAPGKLCFVTGDNVSAGDVVFDEIESKGVWLNACSNTWKKILKPVIKTDLITDNENRILHLFRCKAIDPALQGRITIVHEGKVPPVEHIVRLNNGGGLWEEYSKSGCYPGRFLDNYLPGGLKKGQELPMAIFTPSTKEGFGKHDQNISYAEMVSIYDDWIEENSIIGWTGRNLAQSVKLASLTVALIGRSLLSKYGQELRDTKFEFILVPKREGSEIVSYELRLADEVLTGDSSRIVMNGQHFDKQHLRDYLKEAGWDNKSRFQLPEEVKKKFIAMYRVNAEIAQQILKSLSF